MSQPQHESHHPANAAATGRLAFLMRSLKHRNYRLFFFGQAVSVIGTWTQMTALGWLVLRMTNSPVWLGVAAFCGQVPVFCLAPLAGVIADRMDRRRLVTATQILALVQAAVLGVLTLTGIVALWHILVLGLVLGVVNAFDMPARQSLVVQMLETPKDLPNALALNSLLVNVSRIAGPAIGGYVIHLWGEGPCFVVNAVSYLAVIIALLAMRVRPVTRRPDGRSLLAHLGEGARYAASHAPIRSLLLFVAAVSLLGMPYNVLLPMFARDVLGGGPRIYGLLLDAVGLGAVISVLYVAGRRTVRGLERIMAATCALFGIALIAFGLSRWLPLSLALLTITGFGAVVQFIGANTLVQTLVDDDKRGRVMSFHTMSFIGMGTFGNLLIGGLAKALGPSAAVMLGGAGCLVAAAVLAAALPGLDRAVHPIYVRMGIVTEPVPNGALRELAQ